MNARRFVVLDTNILVHLVRADTVGSRVAKDHGLLDRAERPIISIVTVGELHALSIKWAWGHTKRDRLVELVRQLVVVELGQGRIVARYAEIDNFCEKTLKPARPMGQNDLWIAATTSVVDGVLFTTDADFEHLKGQFLQLVRVDAKTGATI